ncbi:MAG: DUF952 domain-containing protein [Alphaproteobacteria bacterium]|nr:DUF952 domain-containing protein [Alphaproteobacteria bacterium]
MKDRRIYHVCRRAEWVQAAKRGAYNGRPSDAIFGFIHFSAANQVAASIERHFAGERELLLLTVDVVRLGSALRWEANRGGEMFPHLYGSLPVEAVLAVEWIVIGPDGRTDIPLPHDRSEAP